MTLHHQHIVLAVMLAGLCAFLAGVLAEEYADLKGAGRRLSVVPEEVPEDTVDSGEIETDGVGDRAADDIYLHAIGVRWD